MCNLKDNLHRMTRVEINNLARNRFLDAESQLWIANNAHLQARYYLADNEQLDSDVAKVMWQGRSIVLKSLLVGSGAINDQDQIRKFYHSYVNKSGGLGGRGKDFWRFRSTFVSNPWYSYRHLTHRTPNTPGDVLLEVYKLIRARLQEKNKHGYYSGGVTGSRTTFTDILNHSNLDLKTAIVMSTDSDPTIAKIALQRMAQLST